MVSDDVRQLLGRLGFSEKETALYLAVLERGEATVTEVSDAADISKRYTYEISEDLAERGALELDEFRSPTRVRAVPPSETMDSLVAEVEAAKEELDAVFTRPDPPDIEFDVVHTDQTARKRVRRAIDEAESEVLLSIPGARAAAFGESLAAAVDRGVSVLLLTGDGPSELDADDFGRISTLTRTVDIPLPLTLVADGEFAIVGSTWPFSGGESDRRVVAVRQSELASVTVSAFLSNYWSLGTEEYVADPSPLPRTFDHFRGAVLEATLHGRAGRSVSATATVRPLQRRTDAGRPLPDPGETVRGPVVEVRQALVEPPTAAFGVEAALVVETDYGRLSLGSENAHVEDVVCEEITLEERA